MNFVTQLDKGRRTSSYCSASYHYHPISKKGKLALIIYIQIQVKVIQSTFILMRITTSYYMLI
jgi:hypothetical protein